MDKYKELRELLVNSSGQIAQLLAERDALSEKYHDLLYQVQTKHPNESRHETAKRLINKAENACNGPEAAKRQEGDNNE